MSETGLSQKQVRRIFRDLAREGNAPPRGYGVFRGGATLIRSRGAKIQASLLMALYRDIGGAGVLDSVDIAALEKAYRLYRAMRAEVAEMAKWKSFDISDAWCLAAELAATKAMFETCATCGCTCFTSINQKIILGCPFCD